MKTRLFIFSAFLVLIVFCSASLKATEKVTIKDMELYPTFASVSVYVYISGDAGANSTALLEYRKAATGSQEKWRLGHPLVHLDKEKLGGRMWTGSILFLDEGTTYEVRVTLSDPDGVEGKNPILGKVTTRSGAAESKGPEVWVATSGKDTNPGTEPRPLPPSRPP